MAKKTVHTPLQIQCNALGRAVSRADARGGSSLQEADWIHERRRLERVLELVRAKLGEARREYRGVVEEVVRQRREFWDEFRIKPDDVVETYAVIRQQAQLLSEGERRHRHGLQSVRELSRLERSPYFGRVDFREQGESEAEEIYIGVASLRTEDDVFWVYDWRTPVASLYYDHGPGPAGYVAPVGEVRGELLLKRQFVITEGRLELMFDTGLTIGDELLMKALSGHSDAELHSIVATIQREQNRVIRDDAHRLLVVLGVAGSGKTSAAMQRVAYLLYRHRDELAANQVVLFSPNELYASYVSGVLPELGEERIHQATYQAYLERRLGGSAHVEDPYAQLEGVLDGADPDRRTRRLAGIRFKSSPAFRQVLERYADRLRSEGLCFRPLIHRGREIVSAEEMRRRFAAFSPDVPMTARVAAMRVSSAISSRSESTNPSRKSSVRSITWP